ncbi:MAG: T9SS type A sorting domain-containing protein [Bacteroidetes bacterium]|nr:T9SS type A sorting domain-containing protein [Bacteroidota bacterium]
MRILLIQSTEVVGTICGRNILTKKNLIILFLLILLIPFSIGYAQQTTTRGNLLRINFTKPEINFSDTLWQWTNTSYSSGYLRYYCSKVMRPDSTAYLLVSSVDENTYYPSTYLYLYNLTDKSMRQLVADHPGYDPLSPYYYKLHVEYTLEGSLIFMGERRATVFLKNDSLTALDNINGLSLIHYAGQIEGKSFVVARGKDYRDYTYYLEDLSIPENITLSSKIIVDYGGNSEYSGPAEIHHLKDDLYLYVEDLSNFLYLCSYSSNKITMIKRLRPKGAHVTFPDFTNYRYHNNNIFYIENGDLFKESFDFSTKDFTGKILVIPKLGYNYSFSEDKSFLAQIRNDSLIIHSLGQEKVLNSYNIAEIKHRGYLVDSPYVYIHQIKTVTDVESSTNLPTEFGLEQNYPNPFNSSTTIKYSVPYVGRNDISTYNVVLKIYDLLGREVVTLVNAEKTSGVYEVKFDGTGFASGVYIYRLVNGSSAISKKFVLLK